MKTKTFFYVLTFTALSTLINFNAKSQATTTNTTALGDFIGSNASATLKEIDFNTNANPQMVLTYPGGDLNILTASSGYMINGNMFLWNNGSTFNAYMGVSAGASTTAGFGGANVFCGFQAGKTMTTGSFGVYCGFQAGLKDVTGEYNTFIGYQTGLNTTGMAGGNQAGDYNTFVGDRAGEANTTGQANSYYGAEAGFVNQLGNANCMYGDHSGENTINTDSNVFMGCFSNFAGTAGENNVYAGIFAAYNNGGSFNCMMGANVAQDNIHTDSNVYIGDFCAAGNLAGYDNVFLGVNSGEFTAKVPGQSSNMNVLVGGNTGFGHVQGNYNMVLGYGSDAYTKGCTACPTGAIFNSVAIGAEAIVNGNNQVIIGNNAQYVGIGESADGYYNQPGPQWNLEISTEHDAGGSGGFYNTSNGISSGSTGFSGLRFRDIWGNSANPSLSSVPATNPGPGVLAVDQQGKVIYVTETGGSGTGIGYCNSLTPMASNGGYDLNTSNFYFKGNQSASLTQNDVVIGNDCSYTPAAKLDVLQNSGATPISQSSIGIYVENDDLANGNIVAGFPVIGIKSYVPDGSNHLHSVAGWFEAPPGGGVDNYAIIVPSAGGYVGFGTLAPAAQLDVWGESHNQGNTIIDDPNGGTTALTANSITSTSGTNIGAQGVADNSTFLNIGVAGFATGLSGTGIFHEGIYGAAYDSPGTANDCAGVFVGNVFTTGGSSSAVGFISGSDSTIKRKVSSFSNAISIIKKLSPKTYYFDSNNPYHYPLDTFQHYGFIAQQVQRVVPCIVRTIVTPPLIDTGGHITAASSTIKGLDYNQFAAILTQGMQEQQQTIDSLHNTVDSLRNAFKNIQSCLTQLCNNGHGASRHNGGGSGNTGDSNATILNTQDVTLSGLANAPLLYQNIPNPFSTSTKINYYLPANTQGATIVFYDSYGNKLKDVQLSQTGNGTINLTPENLTSGIYSYSLVVNGNVVDTKRMILQK